MYDRLLTENAERRKAVKLLGVTTELFEGKIAKLYIQATFPCGQVPRNENLFTVISIIFMTRRI